MNGAQTRRAAAYMSALSLPSALDVPADDGDHPVGAGAGRRELAVAGADREGLAVDQELVGASAQTLTGVWGRGALTSSTTVRWVW